MARSELKEMVIIQSLNFRMNFFLFNFMKTKSISKFSQFKFSWNLN